MAANRLLNQHIARGLYLKKKKIEIISYFTKPDNIISYEGNYILFLVALRFFRKTNIFGKIRKKQGSVVFNFFKIYVYTFMYLLKYNRNFKFNNKVSRLVFSPDFNNVKNRFIQTKLPSNYMRGGKFNKKMGKTPFNLKVFFMFLFSYSTTRNKPYDMPNARKNRISISFNILHTLLKAFNRCIL